MKWTNFCLVGASVALAVSASKEIVQGAEAYLRPALEAHTRNELSQPVEIRNATTLNLFSRFFHHFDVRQTTGRCGQSAGGARCPNNQCCSTFDYCGNDAEYANHHNA